MKFRGNLQEGYNSSISDYFADTGAANAYVVTLIPAITAYTSGLRIKFVPTNSNTGGSTIAVNGLSAQNIYYNKTNPLPSGALLANQLVEIVYDGTNFQLVSPSSFGVIVNSFAHIFMNKRLYACFQ